MHPERAQPGQAPGILRLRRLLGAIWALIILAYVVLVAVATGTGRARPAAWMLLIMLLLGGAHALYERKRTAALLAVLNLVVVAVTFRFRGPFAALSLTTAIIQAMLSYLFFRGLRPGRVDIVTHIALAIREERSRRERRYVRAVAWCWAFLMAAMGAVSFAIAFVPTGAFWWWWMNVGPYAVPLGFFIAEWLFRQGWLRRELAAAGPIDWRRLRRIDFLELFEP